MTRFPSWYGLSVIDVLLGGERQAASSSSIPRLSSSRGIYHFRHQCPPCVPLGRPAFRSRLVEMAVPAECLDVGNGQFEIGPQMYGDDMVHFQPPGPSTAFTAPAVAFQDRPTKGGPALGIPTSRMSRIRQDRFWPGVVAAWSPPGQTLQRPGPGRRQHRLWPSSCSLFWSTALSLGRRL